MIRIERNDRPDVLRDPTDGDKELFSHPTVRQALWQMQHGKCCYCETKINTAGQGQAVEHFRPQGQYRKLRNHWPNLLHACSDCNGAKGKQFPTMDDGTPELIDPSDPAIDPEDHIDFAVNDQDDVTFCAARPKNNSPLGDKSIKVMKLDVVGRRRARAVKFKELYAAYLEIRAADPATRNSKVTAFQALLGANHEFAGFARAFACKKNLDQRFGVRIPAGTEHG